MFFSNCKTLDEARSLYKNLMMENHPDHGGDTATCQAINAEFDNLLTGMVFDAFDDYESTTHRTYSSAYRDSFADVLQAVIHFNIRVEIIGFWIYAFESFEVKEQLKELGFWFSSKHRAWIYNGGTKRKVRTPMLLDDIRTSHGSELIREKQTILSIEG